MIKLGAPSFNATGIKDESNVVQEVRRQMTPSGLPLVFTLAQKGSYLPTYVNPEQFDSVYGTKTLDLREKYATHHTPLIRTFAKNGNAMVVCRIKVAGSVTAMLRLSVEVIVKNGRPRLVWHSQRVMYSAVESAFAKGRVKSDYRLGSLSDAGNTLGDTGTTSTLYPIMDISADSDGDFGSLIGIELQVNLPDTTSVARAKAEGALTYSLVLKQRASAISTASIITGTRGQTSAPFLIGSDEKQVRSNLEESVRSIYGPLGQSKGDIGECFVYANNVIAVQQLVGTSELLSPTVLSGIHSPLQVTSSEDYGFINIFSGVTPDGVTTYNGFVVESDRFDGIYLGDGATNYLSGGSDGLPMINARSADKLAGLQIFDKGVFDILSSFNHNRDGLMDPLRFPISSIWDTGFSIETKESFSVPYAARKDLMIFLTPLVVADYSGVADIEVPDELEGGIETVEDLGSDGLFITGFLSRPPNPSETITVIPYAGLQPQSIDIHSDDTWSITASVPSPGNYTATLTIMVDQVVTNVYTKSFTIVSVPQPMDGDGLMSIGSSSQVDDAQFSFTAQISTYIAEGP